MHLHDVKRTANVLQLNRNTAVEPWSVTIAVYICRGTGCRDSVAIVNLDCFISTTVILVSNYHSVAWLTVS